ncbi:MAG: squalene--hopene cyclase, partial [Gammaproteobacteria bacterium]|nr:squalene--hopene cyclase [Gammaproteobacteria bacterium]
MEQINFQNLKSIHQKLESKILSFRNEKGIWDGQLSSSALSTAVALFGLWKYDKKQNASFIRKGLIWLVNNINKDGGYGDTIKSGSNMSTTLLCWSALSIVKDDPDFAETIEFVEGWLIRNIGSLEPALISKAILEHYKSDRTFSVPILAMCALAGRLCEHGWKYVPQLPYQFAALPDRFFKFMNLSVVSYAIPALISMGLVRQKNRPTWNPILRLLNHMVKPRVLKILADKQPDNGGFLEAAPLTGFVLMTMVGAELKENNVCKKTVSFLQESIRKDGSWPIDTNLTTWVTTLAINSFSDETFENIPDSEKDAMLNWLLNQQHKTIHPFTKTHPGGWAWIDLQGGVPDGDDTSGALIALKRLSKDPQKYLSEASMGINWLMGIQNNDGGFPTFCRGWGKLPFDASCPDITAHAIKAFLTWRNFVSPELLKQIDKSISKTIKYLKSTQREDRSWLPLWFGNEGDPNHLNPVYGTSQVLLGLGVAQQHSISGVDDLINSGLRFLSCVQNTDGGWGGNENVISSIEETSLAVRACAMNKHKEPLAKATNWLINHL